MTGDHEVTLTLKKPYPALLAALTNLSIVPEHIVEKVGNAAFNLGPVGSGPYRFVKWDKGVSVSALWRPHDRDRGVRTWLRAEVPSDVQQD